MAKFLECHGSRNISFVRRPGILTWINRNTLFALRLVPVEKDGALTSLYSHQESAPDFDARESRCDALAERYADWLELYLIDEEQTILTQLRIILQDRNTVLSRLAGSLDFNWSKLVQLRESTTDLDIRASRLDTKQAEVISNLGLLAPNFSFFWVHLHCRNRSWFPRRL